MHFEELQIAAKNLLPCAPEVAWDYVMVLLSACVLGTDIKHLERFGNEPKACIANTLNCVLRNINSPIADQVSRASAVQAHLTAASCGGQLRPTY